jgi:hypothetical protein
MKKVTASGEQNNSPEESMARYGPWDPWAFPKKGHRTFPMGHVTCSHGACVPTAVYHVKSFPAKPSTSRMSRASPSCRLCQNQLKPRQKVHGCFRCQEVFWHSLCHDGSETIKQTTCPKCGADCSNNSTTWSKEKADRYTK